MELIPTTLGLFLCYQFCQNLLKDMFTIICLLLWRKTTQIFINDLPLHIQDEKVRNSLFADDSSLDTSGKTVNEIEVTLQKSLNEVSG